MTKITENKYGKYSNEIDKILEKITNFSLDDRSRLDAAYAYDAAAAAYDAAAAYAYDAAAAYAADAFAYAAYAYDAAAAAYDAFAYAAYDADAAAYDATATTAARDNWWKFRRVFWYAILAWLAKDKITTAQFDLLMTGYKHYTATEEKEDETNTTASGLKCVSNHLLPLGSNGMVTVLGCGCSYEFKLTPSKDNSHKAHVFQITGYENA